MRVKVIFAVLVSTFWIGFSAGQPTLAAGQKDDLKGSKEALKETPAATLTRTKLLKVKVTGAFKEVRLGDVLKEFASQVDAKLDTPVMWTYGSGFPFAQKVTYSCKEKLLEEVLDELLTKFGTPGFFVVSKDGHKHDGWVQLTNEGERGYEKGSEPKLTDEEQTDSNERLALAKKLIADGKLDQAKTVLFVLTKKYPHSSAAREARVLWAKIEK
ncbi:MAG: hypothetical protein L0241_24810 [Planctomycetia bacterium]|nr:hypothetical protein [Planctomycetia bacterium]